MVGEDRGGYVGEPAGVFSVVATPVAEVVSAAPV